MCVCGWLPAALNLGGRVICVLISTEQREKEGKLFLFLFLRVCNKAPCSKSFNLSRNEGYISVFWLLRTISPSLSLSAFHSHTYFHQTTAETEPALLMESRQSCLSSLSPFLFVYVHVGEQRLAGAEEQEYKRVFKKTSKSSFKKSR